MPKSLSAAETGPRRCGRVRPRTRGFPAGPTRQRPDGMRLFQRNLVPEPGAHRAGTKFPAAFYESTPQHATASIHGRRSEPAKPAQALAWHHSITVPANHRRTEHRKTNPQRNQCGERPWIVSSGCLNRQLNEDTLQALFDGSFNPYRTDSLPQCSCSASRSHCRSTATTSGGTLMKNLALPRCRPVDGIDYVTVALETTTGRNNNVHRPGEVHE